MDVKIIVWSIALFFGSGLVFRAISDATASSPAGVTLGLQALALAVIVGAVVLVMRKRS
ncbi:MAG: hypothetical protein QOG15_1949 [Solirubrobacteraceae bacterium]|nr:hypothetical protein [Solirubrobacteraceae bacterium]